MRFARSATLGPALVLAALVLVTALVPATPVMDALTQRAVTDATLVRPLAYVALSPICATLDALTVLSLQQHAVVLITLVSMLIAWRIVRARQRGTTAVHETVAAVTFLVGWLVVYAAGAVVPRPMAALRLAHPDDVSIDFHSHTNHSWDGQRWFTAERNRAWHTRAGFDVAYVADHKSIEGALEGLASNPAQGGGATILLPALEARDHSEHVIALNVPTNVAPDHKGEWHDSTMNAADPPILILTIPGKLETIPQTELTGIARLVAIELSDGAPKGIGVTQRDRATILRVARQHDLALVAGSDNHGWGSTAVAWSILRIPGWRGLTPTALDSAIQQEMRTQRGSIDRVYVRGSPDPGRSWVALALTLPAVIARELIDLSWPERVSWLCWIVAAVSIASVPSSRAARETTPRAARKNPDTA